MIVTTGGRGCSVSGASTSVDVSMSTSLSLTRLMRWPNSVDQQLGGVLVDRLGERDRRAHLEQRLDEVGAALGHAVGELLDGDRLGDDDVADLLGRRAGLHVVALFLLARAAERGERAGAAVVLVGKGAGDGELAALAVIVAAAAARARRLGTLGRRRMAAGRRTSRALPLPRRGGGELRAAARRPRRRWRASSSACRRASSAAASSALRFSSARRRSSSLCSTLARSSRRRASSSDVRRASSASRRSFACSSLRRGDLVLRRRTARLRRSRRGGLRRRLGRFGDRLGLGRLGRRRFARAAEDAALLDLDHDRVRAAVAEALLDLAGLDRALEAQRRPGAKLRFFGLVCHSIPSSNLLQPSRSSRRVLRLPDHDRGQ